MNTKKAKSEIFSKAILRIFRNSKTLIGLMGFVIGLFFLIIYNQSSDIDYKNVDLYGLLYRFFPYILLILSIGYFMFGYLEGGKKVDQFTEPTNDEKLSSDLKNEFIEFKNELKEYLHQNHGRTSDLIAEFQYQLSKKNEIQLDDKQKTELFNSFKQSFVENINEDFFKQLKDNIAVELTKEKKGRLELLLKDFYSIKNRLNNEVEKLSRKANVNLVIGSLTTFIALLALSYMVFSSNSSFKSIADMLYHYVPRLSLIVFIEVFAYFFLRLYKLNLSDMKYFQNELTTIELKLASITTAINFGKDIDISYITNEFAKTERNFILKNGETTVELEKSRIEKSDMKEILKSVTEIAKRK